ncbi:MAG: DUF1192 domain-containing protein [Hyphomicrobiaceae bacterium]|nr:DUF1192 domain-containing protein [Hyphomicrobiaceae bacterium]
MQWDDDQPKPKIETRVGEPLDLMAIVDLETRIVTLEAEIARTHQEIERKRRHQAAAAGLFK